MKRIKDFIMLFRGKWFYDKWFYDKWFYIKWFIMLIAFIITVSVSLYFEIRLFSAMKESPFFKMTLFFGCIMYLPWLAFEIYKFILLGEYADLKEYFGWWVVSMLMFLMFNMFLSFGLIFKNGIGF